MCYPFISTLVLFAHNWPPACNAYAPEGMLEYWNTNTKL